MKYKTKAIEKFEIVRKTSYDESEEVGIDFVLTKLGKKPFFKDGNAKEVAKTFYQSFKNCLERLGELKHSHDYKIEIIFKLRKYE